jgi:flagellar biosynthetic protein FliR
VSLRIDISWLIATLLLGIRITAATMLVPVFGPTRVPVPARVLIVMGLSAFMVAVLGVPQRISLDLLSLILAAGIEVLIGAAFAFGFMAAYAATQFAGRALDIQIGFGAAGAINPATQTFSPLFGSLLGMLGVLVFLSMDGHLLLIRALGASVTTFPPGATQLSLDVPALLRHSGVMFSFGLALAGPIMLMLLLADVALAVAARSMPQLNVFVLSFTVKIVLGLIGIAAAVKFATAIFTALFLQSIGYWRELAGAA